VELVDLLKCVGSSGRRERAWGRESGKWCSLYPTWDKAGVKFASCNDGHYPKWDFLHSNFQGFLDIIILPPHHFIILYIFFSSAGKNKPYEGAASSAFIHRPAPMVSDRKESKHVKRSVKTVIKEDNPGSRGMSDH
jgi:hypothetical protein